MEHTIKCSQFVYAKFAIIEQSGNIKESDFQPVAASPDLSLQEMSTIHRQISIGTDINLEDLDAFFLSGPLENGRRALAHHLRSREKAAGRNYYRFIHFIIIEQNDWPLVARNISPLIDADISKSVHHTYIVRNQPEIQKLDLVTINIPDISEEEDIDNVKQFLLPNYRKGFISIIDGLLEHDGIAIKDFNQDNVGKAKLIRAIYSLLPSAISQEISFATQVFQSPKLCYTRIKFLANNRTLTSEYLRDNYVIDWSTGNNISKKDANNSYTSLVMNNFDSKDDLRRMFDIIHHLDIGNLIELTNNSRSNEWVLKPDALNISSKISILVEEKLDLKLLAKMILSRRDISIQIVYNSLITSSNEDLTKITKQELQILVLHIINKSLREDIEFCSTAARCFVEYVYHIESTAFRDSINYTLENAPLQNAEVFFLHCIDDYRFRESTQAVNLLKQWITKQIRITLKLSSKEPLYFIERWKNKGILDQEEICNLYLSVVELNPSFEIIAEILEKDLCSRTIELYKLISRKPDIKRIFHKYPKTYELISYISGDYTDTPEVMISLEELLNQRNLFLAIIYDGLKFNKYGLLSIEMLSLFTRKSFFEGNERQKFTNLILQDEHVIKLGINIKGALAYLEWTTFGKLSDSLAISLNQIDGIKGFVLLSSYDNNIGNSFDFLLNNASEEDILQAFVSLYQLEAVKESRKEYLQLLTSLYIERLNDFLVKQKFAYIILSLIKEKGDSVDISNKIIISLISDVVTAVSNSKDEQDQSINLLADIIKDLNKIKLTNSVIDLLFVIQKRNKINIRTMTVKLVPVLRKIEKELSEQNYARIVLSIQSEVWNNIPNNILTYYKGLYPKYFNELKDLPKKDVVRLGNLLIENRLADFVELAASSTDGKPEIFREVLLTYWKPKNVQDIYTLLDHLKYRNLTDQFEVAEEIILSDSINLLNGLNIQYANSLLSEVSLYLRNIAKIDASRLPRNFDDSHAWIGLDKNLKEVEELIKELKKHLSIDNSQENEKSDNSWLRRKVSGAWRKRRSSDKRPEPQLASDDESLSHNR